MLASVFDFLLGSREVWNKSEGISGQDGENTIHHGAPQAFRWVGEYIFLHGRTIGEKPMENSVDLSEEVPTKQQLNISGRHMN